MAHLDRRKFCCPICLDLLKDPVTTSCGHSYCMSCIKTHWDEEDYQRIHSCPQCRQTFIPRPVLMKNTMLADLLEELKKTEQRASFADYCYARPEDVACDVCPGRKLKATKSCLQCLASYCQLHLQPHFESQIFHQLMDPSKKIQVHNTVSAAERTERQRELEVSRQNIQQRIQDREKDVKELQQQVEAINRSADKAVEDSEKIFIELIRGIEKRRSDVKQQVRSQQETEVSRVKELQEKLEQEITELKRKGGDLNLSHTEDHNQFLHNYPSLSRPSKSTDSSSIINHPLRYFENVIAAVSELRDKLQDVLREDWTSISRTETEVHVSLSGTEPEPKTRAEFLKYSCEITLDPNTVHESLSLSEGNKKVTRMYTASSYADHPDRFTFWEQVLSTQSLSGRCYWEVEWSSSVSVAVVYKNISRTGQESEFGYNYKSWALDCHDCFYSFRHDRNSTHVSGPRSSRVGVYLDHSAGILSFHSVSETMTLLHRVQTTFTQPLYAGFKVDAYSTAELSPLV